MSAASASTPSATASASSPPPADVLMSYQSFIGIIPAPLPMFAAATLSADTSSFRGCKICAPGPNGSYAGGWQCPQHSAITHEDCEKIKAIAEELKGFHPAALVEMRHILQNALDSVPAPKYNQQ